MKQYTKKSKSKGFTLIEVLITLAISGILMTSVYAAFLAQQDSYLAQDQVAEMQQNIRAGIFMMTKEIRMAGFDPTKNAGASITTASVNQLSFTQDIGGGEPDGVDNDGDGTTDETDGSEPDFPNGVLGDPNEAIAYGFSNANDADANGIVDDLNADGIQNDAAPLGRNTGGGFQPVAENVQAIEFRYLDSTGAVTVTPANISSIQISILARAGDPDRKFINAQIYTTASGAVWGPFNDNFRRRFEVVNVKCRNMGL